LIAVSRLSLAEDEADLLALWGFVCAICLEGFRMQAGWAVSRGYGEVAGAELRAVRISLVTAHGVAYRRIPAPPDAFRIELGENRFEGAELVLDTGGNAPGSTRRLPRRAEEKQTMPFVCEPIEPADPMSAAEAEQQLGVWLRQAAQPADGWHGS